MMAKRKILSLFVILTISIMPFLSSLSVSSAYLSTSSNLTPESHLIEGVPYVGQDGGSYCAFASTTMLLKFYGINTTEHEILYNSGAGYSLAYLPKIRFIASGVDTSLWAADRSFLASLYGLSYENWQANSTLPDDECWSGYWVRVKQNITNDIPVVTNVNPFFLPSLRNSYRKVINIPDWIWNNIPDWLWAFIPGNAAHAIVIVGFNESNETVCFNDPAAALFGRPKCGTYVWENLSDFEKAMSGISKKTKKIISYSIGIFKNISDNPLNKTDVFKLVHERNIERMKGNKSAYDKHWNGYKSGIDALEALKKDLGPGIKHRLTTIFSYKRTCLKSLLPFQYKLCYLFDKLYPFFVNLSIWKTCVSLFHRTSFEKYDISQYLWNAQYLFNDTNLSKICRHDAILLYHEAEYWSKLASFYDQFMKRGFFMTLPRAIIIIKRMKEILNNIIEIEENIIEGPSEHI